MRSFFPVLFALTLTACMGEIGDVPVATTIATLSPCDATPARGITFDRLRRLSRTALSNTLTALLGSSTIEDAEIAENINGLPSDTMILAGDFGDDAPVGLAGILERVAKRATTLVLANPQWRAEHFPTCAATSLTTDTCAEDVIKRFGAAVLRRDVEADELATFMAVYRDTGAGESGLAYVMRRFLQAPSMAFHIERGAESAEGSIRLSDFEIASRISYLAADTMPDDELMNAARTGQLQTLDGIRSQVERLLATPSARLKVRDFFRYYTHIDDVPDPLAIHAARLGIADVTGLGVEMHDEAFEFVEHVFWSGGTFADLMTSTAAFPRSPELASVFGTGVATDIATDAPMHAGLLHRPAIMTSPTLRTSPITRGAHLRKLFLCESLGMPPAEDVTERQEAVGNLDAMSNRERVTLLTDAPTCTGCHVGINATGFAFEAFDQVGAPRSEEVVLDASGAVVATWPIDTSVADARLDDSEPLPVSDSQELAVAIAESELGRACIAQRLFEYFRAAEVATADACVVDIALTASSEGSLQSTITALIANDDIFWRKEPAQ